MRNSTTYYGTRFTRLYRNISLSGINDELPFNRIKKVRVLNSLSIAIAIVLLLTNVRWVMADMPEFIFLNLAGIIVMILVVFSNRRYNYSAAQLLFFIYVPMHITILSLLMHFGFELFFFPVIIIAGFVFESRKLLIFYLLILTASIIFIEMDIFNLEKSGSSSAYEKIFYNVSVSLSVILCYLSINLFTQEYEENRSEILIKNEMLQETAAITREKALFNSLLLREMNHRVKNNLQLISSLLNIHAQKIEDSTAKSALQEAKSRVHSIALIHKQLYKDQDINSVNIAEYIKDLINNISGTTPGHANEIDFNYKCNNFTINVDDAVSIGLIINELISNSFRHGLAEVIPKKVNLEVNKSKDDKLHITIEDNGSGLQKGFTEDNKGFGYELIETLTQSYMGSVEVDKIVNRVKVMLNLSRDGS